MSGMPPEVIDLLAGLSVERAVFLALGLVGSGSFVVLLAANARRSLDPRPALHQGAVHAGHDLNRAYALLVLHVKQARDCARRVLVAVLQVALAHLDSSSSASKKGAAR